MALALKDRVKETTIVVGTGTATLLGSSIGFQPFSVVGNGNTTYYCISDQFGSNWEVGIGTYSTSGNTLARTTVLASSNGGALVVFTAGIKDVFVTYPAEKGVWLDASGNAIGLGTPAAFVGTNITGTASGLTAGNVTTNANLTGAVTSSGNATSLGSFTSAQLALAISDETGTGKAVFATNPTLTSPTYAGTLTGSTDILNIGSGQVYKDASGNVGIGTSSPGARLDVGNSGGSLSLRLSRDANNRLDFSHGAGVSYIDASPVAGQLAFATVGTERMRIDSSGNVGIGTSSPASKLTIAGGTLSITGVAATQLNSFASSGTTTAMNYGYISNTGSSLFLAACNSGGTGALNQVVPAYSALIGNSANAPLVFTTNSNYVGQFDASGNLLVGTTSTAITTQGIAIIPSTDSLIRIAHVLGTAANSIYIQFGYNAVSIGSITQSGTTGVAYNTTSDYRLKTDVLPIQNALTTIESLNPVSFNWIDGRHDAGFLAHELQEVIPNCVTGEKDAVNEDGTPKYQQMDNSGVVPFLVKSIQELKAIIDTQQEQINSLLGK